MNPDTASSLPEQTFIPPPPPKTFAARMAVAFVEWVEQRNIAHSKYGDPPIYKPHPFSWVADVEQEWQKIRRELDVVLHRRDELPNFQEISTDVKSIQRDDQWKTFMFLGYGKTSDENLRRCPETARILKKNPRPENRFLFNSFAQKAHSRAPRTV
jgi:ornithine lipid ester-linked acyl 2-hydroxylase